MLDDTTNLSHRRKPLSSLLIFLDSGFPPYGDKRRNDKIGGAAF